MTEEEAKTKWCPHVRAGNEAGCNRNDRDANGSYVCCIASECMAWRWEDARYRHRAATTHADTDDGIPPEPEGDDWYAFGPVTTKSWMIGHSIQSLPTQEWKRSEKLLPNQYGYCGLAGKP